MMAKSLLHRSHYLVPDRREGPYSSYKWKPAVAISVHLKINCTPHFSKCQSACLYSFRKGYKVTVSTHSDTMWALWFLKVMTKKKKVPIVGQEKLGSCEDHPKECGVIKIFPSLTESTCWFSIKDFTIFQSAISVF